MFGHLIFALFGVSAANLNREDILQLRVKSWNDKIQSLKSFYDSNFEKTSWTSDLTLFHERTKALDIQIPAKTQLLWISKQVQRTRKWRENEIEKELATFNMSSLNLLEPTYHKAKLMMANQKFYLSKTKVDSLIK